MKSCNINKDLALLIARVIIGGLFIFAGWMKVTDMAMVVTEFAKIGFPAFLAYFVGYAELIGGILLVVGAWTRKSALLLAIIMIVAVWVTREAGAQVFGYPLALFAGLFALAGTGSGKYAVKPCGCCNGGEHGATCGVVNS